MGNMPLRTLRDQWIEAADEIEEMETRWVRSFTIQESVRQFLRLYKSFQRLNQETESMFWPEKEAYLIERERRLRRLAERMRV